MSVFSRIVLAGVISASLMSVQAQAADKDGDTGHTGGRFLHATKCLGTFGFGEGCDKDAPVTKQAHEERKAEQEAAVTKVSTDTGTRAQFFHASKCVTTLGFGSGCDKKQPYGTTENPKVSPAAEASAGPDTSTRGQLMHASKCVMSFGFVGDCDKK